MFLEDALIQVAPPRNADAVFHLAIGGRRYLYPFKAEILKYFSPAEIAERTELVPNPQTNSLRLEFRIPVENNRAVKVTREYPLDSVIAEEDIATAELAAWPDFTSPGWTRYFYFKNVSSVTAGSNLLDFEPTIPSLFRNNPNHTWYMTREPVEAFVGSVDGKSGLLLLRNNSISMPNKFWKVGVDFGRYSYTGILAAS